MPTVHWRLCKNVLCNFSEFLKSKVAVAKPGVGVFHTFHPVKDDQSPILLACCAFLVSPFPSCKILLVFQVDLATLAYLYRM